MARVELDVDLDDVFSATAVPALTDFTGRRTEIWPHHSERFYEVREIGDSTAIVREGQTKPPPALWAVVERYEWGPDRVRWTVERALLPPGSFVKTRFSRTGG